MDIQLFFEVGTHRANCAENRRFLRVVDDPVIMHLQFQQFYLYIDDVPQIQFIVRVSDFAVVQQRPVFSAHCADNRRDSTGACAVRRLTWVGDGD